MRKTASSARRISPEMFVRLYMESVAAGHTMDQFSQRLGCSYGRAYSRVSLYRKRGVRLPPLAPAKRGLRAGNPLDIRSLNGLVSQMAERELRDLPEFAVDRR
jgi:hypothetical protein